MMNDVNDVNDIFWERDAHFVLTGLERGGEGIVHCATCLTLYVNMMNDKYELAELRGNPEFYTGWSVHCDGVRASQ